MDATISLVKKLQSNRPDITFVGADSFGWDPTTTTVTYSPTDPEVAALLLHEYAHALCGHRGYNTDITLLQMERDAWDKAKQEASRYDVQIAETTVAEALDTYRDWLHARSRCPECGETGYQAQNGQYTCLACQAVWRTNEARTCALRRYSVKKRP